MRGGFRRGGNSNAYFLKNHDYVKTANSVLYHVIMIFEFLIPIVAVGAHHSFG